MAKTVLNVRELAEELRISLPVAYQLVNRADFPAIRISEKRIIVPRDGLVVWMRKQIAQKAVGGNGWSQN